MKDESLLTATTTTNLNGHHTLTDIPTLNDYTAEQNQFIESKCPAVLRYNQLLKAQPKSFADQLRIERHKSWLPCAYASFFDSSQARDICIFWSLHAQKIMQKAWKECGGDQCPIACLAMGKLGANELNLSSDVDIILISEDKFVPPRSLIPSFQRILQDQSIFGYCLRVDFDLRPGGKRAPLLPTVSQFENHYEVLGETWERIAFLRSRFCWGPEDLCTRLSQFLERFSFRKHLDYTLLDDLKELRQRIHHHHFSTTDQGFDLKHSSGGIRDIELFVNSLQLIHGGKNPSVRTNSTSLAIAQLTKVGALEKRDGDCLEQCYWYYRQLENKVQAVDDRQTHYFKINNSKNYNVPGRTQDQFRSHSRQVAEIVSSLLGKSDTTTSNPLDSEIQDEWLANLGFSRNSISNVWPALSEASALSKRSRRDESARKEFLRLFVEKLADTEMDKDLGLALLLDFVKAVRAKASFFTLFLHEPKLVRDISWLFSTSPYLGGLLASRPELLDSYVYHTYEEYSDDMAILLEQLSEKRLLTELIAASRFLSERNLLELNRSLSLCADEICTILMDRLTKEYHVEPIGLLALGKWGSCELGLKSDLDFVFVLSGQPVEQHHKVCRRFVARVTEQHKGGCIYPVDMRLRPSGRAGPLLVSAEQLNEYLNNQAEVWERQAYLRARPLTSLPYDIQHLVCNRPLLGNDLIELADIRKKLMVYPSRQIDLKFQSGGIVDIELAVQTKILQLQLKTQPMPIRKQIERLAEVDNSWKQQASDLTAILDFLRTTEQLYQLTTNHSGSALNPESDSFKRLARLRGSTTKELKHRLLATLAQSSSTLKNLDPSYRI